MILGMRSSCVDLFPLYIKHYDLSGRLKDSGIFNNLLGNRDVTLYPGHPHNLIQLEQMKRVKDSCVRTGNILGLLSRS